MKKSLLFVICFFIFFGCGTEADINSKIDMSERLISISSNTQFSENANEISSAIVGICSSGESDESVGTGVCVASGGYIITNAHVISYPSNIKLYLFNGDTSSATLIYEDTSLDIAILKSNKTLPYLKMADVDNLKVGEEIVAIGTPISLLLKHTFTKGIVSALNRTLKVTTLSGESLMQNLIQHDASINPGNSGGPLLNLSGEIVGINTLKISSSEGIGFAIPVKSFYSLLTSIIGNLDYDSPYLGIYGYDAEIANYYDKTTEKNGVYIINLAQDSPLIKLGINKTDIITHINGVKITNMLDLRNELFKYPANSSITITVLSKNEKKDYSVNLTSHPINQIMN